MAFSLIALNASAFQLMMRGNASKIELHTGAFTCQVQQAATHELKIKISVPPTGKEGGCQVLKIKIIVENVFF
ncbi:hypothetical protein [Aeromonas veronii]|uniref:hypothetical protein n=1 Tax=Aeromonas veronii TaxID=654 RepID=UPI003D25D061